MEFRLWKKMRSIDVFNRVTLVIQVFIFVSYFHSSSSSNTTSSYNFLSPTLKMANDTSFKYKNQTIQPTVVKSRRKRSVIFPTGSDLSFTVSLQFPIAALSATSKWLETVEYRNCPSMGDKAFIFNAHPKMGMRTPYKTEVVNTILGIVR